MWHQGQSNNDNQYLAALTPKENLHPWNTRYFTIQFITKLVLQKLYFHLTKFNNFKRKSKFQFHNTEVLTAKSFVLF